MLPLKKFSQFEGKIFIYHVAQGLRSKSWLCWSCNIRTLFYLVAQPGTWAHQGSCWSQLVYTKKTESEPEFDAQCPLWSLLLVCLVQNSELPHQNPVSSLSLGFCCTCHQQTNSLHSSSHHKGDTMQRQQAARKGSNWRLSVHFYIFVNQALTWLRGHRCHHKPMRNCEFNMKIRITPLWAACHLRAALEAILVMHLLQKSCSRSGKHDHIADLIPLYQKG